MQKSHKVSNQLHYKKKNNNYNKNSKLYGVLAAGVKQKRCFYKFSLFFVVIVYYTDACKSGTQCKQCNSVNLAKTKQFLFIKYLWQQQQYKHCIYVCLYKIFMQHIHTNKWSRTQQKLYKKEDALTHFEYHLCNQHWHCSSIIIILLRNNISDDKNYNDSNINTFVSCKKHLSSFANSTSGILAIFMKE